MEPKTKHSRRTIALPAPVAEALKVHRIRHVPERLQADGLWEGDSWRGLVLGAETGRRLSGFYRTKHACKLLRVAGLPPMRYHDLRHGAPSIMAAFGVSPRTAMETPGHPQVSTTMNICTPRAPQCRRGAMDRLDPPCLAGSGRQF